MGSYSQKPHSSTLRRDSALMVGPLRHSQETRSLASIAEAAALIKASGRY
jgi:hypothetical protein